MAESLLNTENRYSGIPTIYKEMQKHNLPKPVFIDKRNEFVVILYNKKISEDNEVERLIDYCSKPRTREEIMNFMKITPSSYLNRKFLQPLIKEGIIQLTLPNKPKSKYQKYYTVW